jgi:hypothetical protein
MNKGVALVSVGIVIVFYLSVGYVAATVIMLMLFGLAVIIACITPK